MKIWYGNFWVIYHFIAFVQLKEVDKLISDIELKNCFDENVHVFKAAFHLTLVNKNHQNGEHRKRSGYL